MSETAQDAAAQDDGAEAIVTVAEATGLSRPRHAVVPVAGVIRVDCNCGGRLIWNSDVADFVCDACGRNADGESYY